VIIGCEFGNRGGNNDLNVLDRSPLVRNLLTGHANVLGFWVNSIDMIDTTYLLTEFILNEVVSCKVYKIQKTKKTTSMHIKNLCEKMLRDVLVSCRHDG
jgi:hypothetical protein